MTIYDLPPWDAIPYVLTPKESTFAGAVQGVQIIGADPQRYCVIFSNLAGVSPQFISTTVRTGGNFGFVISVNAGILILNTRQHGPLPTFAFFTGSNNTSLHILEMIANRWPDDGNDPLKNIQHPVYVPPPRKISTAPGVGGRMGILDFWHRLLGR